MIDLFTALPVVCSANPDGYRNIYNVYYVYTGICNLRMYDDEYTVLKKYAIDVHVIFFFL